MVADERLSVGSRQPVSLLATLEVAPLSSVSN